MSWTCSRRKQSEMTLGAFGPGGRGGREMYGMGGRGGMMNPYGMGGMGFGGVGGENKRRRPASLLLDESPLKITLRINSLKVVAKEKDDSDAISALANKIEEAKVEEDKGGDDDVFVKTPTGMALMITMKVYLAGWRPHW